MTQFHLRAAVKGDADALHAALAALSREIGDPHRATRAGLCDALFGPRAFARALIGESGGGLAGLALFTPVFSTVRGGAGVRVSDLWVDPAARGQGLGLRLLAGVARDARAGWEARFLRLSVHDDNRAARRFYEASGFAPAGHETAMILAGAAFDTLEEQA